MAPSPDPREREALGRDLASTDEEARRLAVERVTALPTDEAVPLLIECLGDASWRVRKTAVERLAVLSDSDRITRSLVEALADAENSGRRNAALEALIRCGAAAVPILLDASTDPDGDVRKQVVDALAGIGDRRAASRLVAMLEDRDPNVRGAVADALGVLGMPELAPPLLRAAHDDMERLVRLSALRALSRLEVSLPAREVAGLIHDPHLRGSAFELLGHSDDPEAFEQLLKGLESTSRGAREAAMASLLRGLGRAEPDELDDRARRIREAAAASQTLLPVALERLSQAGLPQRLMLIQFLGLLGDGASARPILEAARDEALLQVARETLVHMGAAAEEALVAAWPDLDGELRLIACEVLARTAGRSAEPCLLVTLNDRDPALRAAAARALGARGCAGALERLIERLHAAAGSDPAEGGIAEAEALCDAIVALASEGDEGASADVAVQRLLGGLSGGREAYRCAVAEVLGRLGRADHGEAMGLLLSDPSASVRRAAVEGLTELDDERAAEPLRLALADEAPEVRTAAAACLARRSDPSAFPHLAALAQDPSPEVRAAAVRATGQRLHRGVRPEERPAAFTLFEKGLADDGPVAMAVADALLAAGGADAARVAVGLLRRPEPELAQAAVACIGRHGEAEVLSELQPLLSHAAWSVRAQAVQCLAARGVVAATPAILRRLELEQDPFVREAILAALRRLES